MEPKKDRREGTRDISLNTLTLQGRFNPSNMDVPHPIPTLSGQKQRDWMEGMLVPCASVSLLVSGMSEKYLCALSRRRTGGSRDSPGG